MNPQLRKIICFLWVVPLHLFLTIVYQLIVKGTCASVHRCLLFLWSVKTFYFIMTRRNILQYLIHFIGLGQKSCIPCINMSNQLLFCTTLECYPLDVGNIIGIAQPLMNSCSSDTSCHNYSFPGPRVIVARMPTSESWCVKSILLAAPLLGS